MMRIRRSPYWTTTRRRRAESDGDGATRWVHQLAVMFASDATTTIPFFGVQQRWSGDHYQRRQHNLFFSSVAAIIAPEDDHNDNSRQQQQSHRTPLRIPPSSSMKASSSSLQFKSSFTARKQQHRPRPRLNALRQQLATASSVHPPSTSATSLAVTTGGFASIAQWNHKSPSSSSKTPNSVLNPNSGTRATTATSNATSSVITASSPSSSSTSIDALRQRLATMPDPQLSQQTLTDQHARHHNYVRLSLTERCNLRCTYCMPEQGVPLSPPSHLLSTSELLHLATLLSNAGVTKWRLTGGEPTLRSDLVDIVAGLHTLKPQSIGITTNGIVLASKIHDLYHAGLTSVNISLDTLNPTLFSKLTRRPATYLTRVHQSIEAAMSIVDQQTNNNSSDRQQELVVKINCVIMRGVNDHEVVDFVNMIQQYPKLQIRFIEYMPFADNGWDWSQCVPYQELIQTYFSNNNNNETNEDGTTRTTTTSNVMLHPIPSKDPNDTTKWYTTDTFGGRVGFITSMSEHFCASCNRLRITADGQIKVCLFDGRHDNQSNGMISLRDAIRAGWDESEIRKLIYTIVQTKHAALGGHENPIHISRDAANNRPMTLIGG